MPKLEEVSDGWMSHEFGSCHHAAGGLVLGASSTVKNEAIFVAHLLSAGTDNLATPTRAQNAAERFHSKVTGRWFGTAGYGSQT